MISIQDLLSRIRWDKNFGKGSFEIGYFDHVERKIIRVPLQELHFEPGNSFSFDLHTAGGEVITIPFHRIREVCRDGLPIWSREKGP
ncbi:MAG: DUF504 domain-containing protein [Desulfobacterota bacterium]|jgi:uncharacterized protein (UPF0248 family)|nr:DUF504 domain-containing protein [Thermodesulfobacteriota bacterium]